MTGRWSWRRVPGCATARFADPSGGRHDSYCLAIGHFEGTRTDGRFVLDVVRGAQPPFDPQEVTTRVCRAAARVRLSEVTGDNYAAAWVETAFRDAGISYVRSEKPKSALYLEAQTLVCARWHFAAGPSGVAARVAVVGASHPSLAARTASIMACAATTITPTRCWAVPRWRCGVATTSRWRGSMRRRRARSAPAGTIGVQQVRDERRLAMKIRQTRRHDASRSMTITSCRTARRCVVPADVHGCEARHDPRRQRRSRRATTGLPVQRRTNRPSRRATMPIGSMTQTISERWRQRTVARPASKPDADPHRRRSTVRKLPVAAAYAEYDRTIQERWRK